MFISEAFDKLDALNALAEDNELLQIEYDVRASRTRALTMLTFDDLPLKKPEHYRKIIGYLATTSYEFALAYAELQRERVNGEVLANRFTQWSLKL